MAMLDPEHRRPLSRKVRQIHSADHGTRYAVACADAAERRRGTGNEIAELVKEAVIIGFHQFLIIAAVPLHFQDDARVRCRDGQAVRVQEIRAPQTGPDIVVKGHPDIAGGIDERLPHIVHDGSGPQSLIEHFAVQFLNQGIAGVQHPGPVPVDDGPGFLGGQGCAELGAQPADLAFLLQVDQGRVSVVVPDAELLAHIHAVNFLPQRLVLKIVKVQAADQVFSIPGVRVCVRDCPQPLPDRQKVRIPDFMLPFMPVLDRIVQVLSSFARELSYPGPGLVPDRWHAHDYPWEP